MSTPALALKELDERVEAGGLRVRLLYAPVSPSEVVLEVYEGFESRDPELTFLAPAESAREAFLHPYAYAP